ncbi:MAG: starch-binding protein [Ruminococcus sp.]|nr:starch-binding protein [Ruminococcus sp.]
MKKIHKIVAFLLALAVLVSAAVVTTAAVNTKKADTGAGGITVHYYCEGGTPNIYYWNSLPDNIETSYPGPSMTSEGNNWYRYTFSGKTKINMLFVKNGVQSAELTRETGEWWYKNNRWYSKDPAQADSYERVDMREDSIYFVMTTRFYDGDSSNNVHCWDDGNANNPDSDKAWRGDFKGLIERLDYIKALGFTTVWVTPVVENASGYDFHGYHAFDFTKVDPRYESSGATYQDLIEACHEKGMKIVQDVVWNHTGNFGESNLCHMFDKKYTSIKDLEKISCMQINQNGPLAKNYPNYNNMQPDAQYQARLACMKEDSRDTANNFHHSKDMSYESYTEQTGQIAGDCVDINTENPTVAKYLTDTYMDYVDMGVDSFRLDTEKHISRWTLNHAYFPKFTAVNNFFLFGEHCARVRDIWNHGVMSSSPAFFGWKESGTWASNWSTTDWQANLNNSIQHYTTYSNPGSAQTSTNAFLNGIEYHTPDYSKGNRTSTIDFRMHWNFENANSAFGAGVDEDRYFNDSTWNVMYVDSHDYGPDSDNRYNGGEQAWAENMDLMWTFRGIPCLYYGSETQFQAGQPCDKGTTAPLSATGRAYYGDNLTGSITTTDFGKYTASGNVATTLGKPLAVHLRQLNLIRQAVPALQKGQYTTDGNYVSNSNIAYIRRYKGSGVDSLACVAISGGATFKNIPNGTYIDAVTGTQKSVTNGTLNSDSIGKANMRVWVCCASGFKGINGKIGVNGTYLK